MNRCLVLCFGFSLWVATGKGQAQEQPNEAMKKYIAEQAEVNKRFIDFFYAHYQAVNTLPETAFLHKTDSLRQVFDSTINQYTGRLDPSFLEAERSEIKYFFDRLILDYISNYESFAGKKLHLSDRTKKRLNRNVADFNNPTFLSNPQFVKYVKAYLEQAADNELIKQSYKKADNRKLLAIANLTDSLFTDSVCNEYWKYTYLYDHIDNLGIKNIEPLYDAYINTSKDTSRSAQIMKLYQEAKASRNDHLIKPYKTVDGFDLDLHLFLPDASYSGQRPLIIFFHGGSWTEGKPDWSFGACKQYAAKGWIACAAEYRVQGRHGTLPFAAVKDARSAIRWLRKNAAVYHIDTGKIVASGNSSGGHLALTAALSHNTNEQTDNLNFSAVPNFLIVHAGVYDLMDQNTAWIRKSAKSLEQVKAISPLHLIQNKFPPALLIHGTNDQNCPYPSAIEFASKMKEAGNKDIEMVSLEGASHFIWFDPKYSKKIEHHTQEFLKRQGLLH